MGFFITFEGGEGSGKTTQLEKLAQALEKKGFPVLKTREPGGSVIGAKIRQILLDGNHEDLHPLTELLLYAADRAQHVREVLRPALAQNKIILCDRYQDSTDVYQGAARGLDPRCVQTLGEIATDGLTPHWTLLLDMPVEIGLRRSKKRLTQENSNEDRFEKEALEFHEKVREGFLRKAQRDPERFIVFNADQDPDRLHQEILSEVLKRLNP